MNKLTVVRRWAKRPDPWRQWLVSPSKFADCASLLLATRRHVLSLIGQLCIVALAFPLRFDWGA